MYQQNYLGPRACYIDYILGCVPWGLFSLQDYLIHVYRYVYVYVVCVYIQPQYFVCVYASVRPVHGEGVGVTLISCRRGTARQLLVVACCYFQFFFPPLCFCAHAGS